MLKDSSEESRKRCGRLIAEELREQVEDQTYPARRSHEQTFPRVEEKATNFAEREAGLIKRSALCFIS